MVGRQGKYLHGRGQAAGGGGGGLSSRGDLPWPNNRFNLIQLPLPAHSSLVDERHWGGIDGRGGGGVLVGGGCPMLNLEITMSHVIVNI